MARGDFADVLNISGDEIEARVRGTHPIEDVRETFKENIHAANRHAKKILVEKTKKKLMTGVPNEGYDEEYAERKRKDPRAKSSIYGKQGPVDFRYSGRLWKELVGRGRAKPSEPSLNIWLGLKHPNRKRPKGAPGGGGTTYKQLANILRDEKPGPDGDPFQPTDDQRRELAKEVADRLMGVKG